MRVEVLLQKQKSCGQPLLSPRGTSVVLNSHALVMTPATLSPRGWTDGLEEEEEKTGVPSVG